MSSTKHITQGGQVFSYMLNMFMQVNKRISFWLLLSFVIFVPTFFYFRLPWQHIRNGGLYWWLHLTAGGEKALYRVPPRYDIPYDGKVLHATSQQILSDAYMKWAGDMVLQELWLSLTWASVAVLVLAFGIYRFLRRLGEKQAQDEQVGGRDLTDDVRAVAKLMHKRGDASTLHFDVLPLKLNSEVQSILLHGTPGSGKSNAINKLLLQLRERGDMVIVYDKGCSLVKKHFNENTDVLLNPLDTRCANWSLFHECETIPDFDTAANTLIPMSTKDDPFWQGSARTIFTAVAYRLKKEGHHTYNKLLRTLLAINLKDLREYLTGTEASNLVEEKVEKTAISIRSVLTNYVKALRYLQGIERSGKPIFTIRNWMKQVNEPKKSHGWLFITSNARQHESLKPLISMWLAQAANCLLEMGENPTRRVWFIYDELYSLNKLPDLPAALAEGRKFGGCFALGFQNKPQLDSLYGVEFANAMMDLLNTRLFFRSPDEIVASYVMRQLGQRRARIFNEQYSYGADTVRDGVSFSKQEEDQYLVNYSSIQSLPDLSCYVTLPGDYPVVRMDMTYLKMKPCAAELLLRNINDSLDPEIDAEIEKRDLEEADISRLTARAMGVPETSEVAGTTSPAVPAAVAASAVAASVVSATSSDNKNATSASSDTQVATATTIPPVAASTTTDTGGVEAELKQKPDAPEEIVDMDSGEILHPGDEGYDAALEQFNRAFGDTQDAMRLEERNLVIHRRDKSDIPPEPDDGHEPGGGW